MNMCLLWQVHKRILGLVCCTCLIVQQLRDLFVILVFAHTILLHRNPEARSCLLQFLTTCGPRFAGGILLRQWLCRASGSSRTLPAVGVPRCKCNKQCEHRSAAEQMTPNRPPWLPHDTAAKRAAVSISLYCCRLRVNSDFASKCRL